MKFLLKQRFFSWLDSFEIYNEYGETVYTVESEFDFTHNLHIYDASEREIGSVVQKFFTFMPKFEVYMNGEYQGCIKKVFMPFSPTYEIEGANWNVEGDFMEWDYTITDENGEKVATIEKELFKWTDTYSIDVKNEKDAVRALLFVLAIDAEKCSRG